MNGDTTERISQEGQCSNAKEYGEYFTYGIHDIFDAVPNNVLVGDDGNFYFIDTITFKADTDGLDTYKKYSPNYSKKRVKPYASLFSIYYQRLSLVFFYILEITPRIIIIRRKRILISSL